MKYRHSIEKKGLLEAEKKDGSRYNPQSSANITSYSVNINKTPLKRSESTSTLRLAGQQIYNIHSRYRTLEQNYKELLSETRQKGQLYRKQKEELQKYQQLQQSDQREIIQLRSLIDLIRRTETSSRNNLNATYLLHSQQQQKRFSSSVPKQRESPLEKKNQQMDKQLTNSRVGSGLKKNSRVRLASKPPFSKYKFIPTLPL